MSIFNKLVDNMLFETTTSGDIAFVPSHLGGQKAKIPSLLKRKKSWKIKMTEDPIKEEYTMDLDGHAIKVQKKHWQDFQNEMKEYGEVEKDGEERYFSVFSSLLAEAAGEETAAHLDAVRDGLLLQIDKSPCADAARSLAFFSKVFPCRYEGDNVAILFHDEEKGIQKILDEVEVAYEDDRGAYEILINSLEQQRSLKFSTVINEYKYLFGAVALANYKGVAIKFECFVDMNYVPHESLQVLGADKAVAEMDGFEKIKAYGTTLYPRSKHFPFATFNRLKKELDSVEEEA